METSNAWKGWWREGRRSFLIEPDDLEQTIWDQERFLRRFRRVFPGLRHDGELRGHLTPNSQFHRERDRACDSDGLQLFEGNAEFLQRGRVHLAADCFAPHSRFAARLHTNCNQDAVRMRLVRCGPKSLSFPLESIDVPRERRYVADALLHFRFG